MNARIKELEDRLRGVETANENGRWAYDILERNMLAAVEDTKKLRACQKKLKDRIAEAIERISSLWVDGSDRRTGPLRLELRIAIADVEEILRRKD